MRVRTLKDMRVRTLQEMSVEELREELDIAKQLSRIAETSERLMHNAFTARWGKSVACADFGFGRHDYINMHTDYVHLVQKELDIRTKTPRQIELEEELKMAERKRESIEAKRKELFDGRDGLTKAIMNIQSEQGENEKSMSQVSGLISSLNVQIEAEKKKAAGAAERMEGEPTRTPMSFATRPKACEAEMREHLDQEGK